MQLAADGVTSAPAEYRAFCRHLLEQCEPCCMAKPHACVVKLAIEWVGHPQKMGCCTNPTRDDDGHPGDNQEYMSSHVHRGLAHSNYNYQEAKRRSQVWNGHVALCVIISELQHNRLAADAFLGKKLRCVNAATLLFEPGPDYFV